MSTIPSSSEKHFFQTVLVGVSWSVLKHPKGLSPPTEFFLSAIKKDAESD